MATPSIEHFEAGSFRASMRLSAASLPHPADSAGQADSLYISSATALNAAKGALLAIGLEAMAALCLLGVWLIWHLSR